MTEEYKPLLSIIVPCYNEEAVIPIFINKINNVLLNLESIEYELIFVDDGSSDETINLLRSFSKKNTRIRFISFSRNFGKEAAMLAGLEAAQGDFITVMDADLQDPPSLLPNMLEAINNEGYDIVATRRDTRKGESPVRSFFARRFYSIINKISDTEIVDGARDFRIMTKQVVDAILSLKEYNRFSKGIFSWVGFKTKWISYENLPRVAGTTKWSFWKLLKYSVDGIVGFSTVPLAIATVSGFFFCLMAFLGILFVIIRWTLIGDPVAGWASTICIVLFVSGIQLLCTGILGQYIAKNYLETKNRPIYIIKEQG